jgi:hypothetical protein
VLGRRHAASTTVAAQERTLAVSGRDLSGAQIHPSRSPGVFVDQSAKPVAAVGLI